VALQEFSRPIPLAWWKLAIDQDPGRER
jgi:hypothetical protein